MKKRRVILIGYKIGSQSLKNLQQQIKDLKPDNRVLRVRKTSTTYKRRLRDVVLNWGPCLPSQHVIMEQEQAKMIANDKLKTFVKLREHNVPHPEWTTNATEAMGWNTMYLARTLLRSHSGKGIVIVEAGQEPPHAKLYVQYKKKKHEFRVHVFNKKVIDVTQKKKKVGHEDTNHQIRNHQNGWVYCRENIQKPDGIEELALNACAAIGLNHGAVDIIYNQLENKCYVLEINTAPGVEGTTCLKYAEEIVTGI